MLNRGKPTDYPLRCETICNAGRFRSGDGLAADYAEMQYWRLVKSASVRSKSDDQGRFQKLAVPYYRSP